jgi:hypothetical protein
MQVDQLKTYLTDTFNKAFGYPDYQPWTIGELEYRLESICEILSSTNPMLNTTERIFQELLSTMNTIIPIPLSATDVFHDIFEKASNAFYEAKNHFVVSNGNQYSWSDGGCTWVNTAETAMNARQHDDKLIFTARNGYTPSSCSIIISCLATVGNRSSGNIVTLSIGSPINGQVNRIPIGQYRKNQNYTAEFKDNFIVELKNLIISICKQRKAIQP